MTLDRNPMRKVQIKCKYNIWCMDEKLNPLYKKLYNDEENISAHLKITSVVTG